MPQDTTPTPTAEVLDRATLTHAVVTLAEARDANDDRYEPATTARAIMRGDATPEERKQRIVEALVAAGITPTTPAISHQYRMTAQRAEVLGMLADGLSTTEAAARSYRSFATTKNHVRNILAQFGVSSRVEAVVQAVRCGLVAYPTVATTPAPARYAVGRAGSRFSVVDLTTGQPTSRTRYRSEAAAQAIADELSAS